VSDKHKTIQVAPDGSDHAPYISRGDLGEFKRKLEAVLEKRGLKHQPRLKYGKQAKGK
tara:strand:- start:248 stop:421 length:174 start_codon:yes stop_codon:yes gene_type:complete